MAKEPSLRFETVMDFASAFRAAAGETPSGQVSRVPVPSASGSALQRPSDPSALPTAAQQSPTVSALGQAQRLPDLARVAGAPESREPSLSGLLDALASARRARSARDIELAASLVEGALAIADQLDEAETSGVLEREEALIEGSLEMRLGRRDRPLRVLPPRSGDHVSLLPEEAFLLSRIDGVASIEEIVDLSPLPRLRTLRLLVRMLGRRLISSE